MILSDSDHRSSATAVLGRLGGLLAVALFAGWALRYLPLGPRLSGWGAVSNLGPPFGPLQWLGWALFLLLLLRASWTHRLDGLGRRGFLVPVLIAAALAPFAVRSGHLLLLLVSSMVVAVLLAVSWPLDRRWPRAPSNRRVGAGLYLTCFVAHCVFSMHRHWAFGSGSWDLGCMVHNFHLASRGLDTTSSVLGGVDFLGDHFMPGIYLFAPLFWLNGSAYMVLAVQAASLAAATPAIFAIARQYGADTGLASALALATGLGFGMQSAAYFDAHAITVGFGLLPVALWALEKDDLRTASFALAVFATFKESLGAYVVGLGLMLVVRSLRLGSPRLRTYGLAWMGLGTLWFVLVNRGFMPVLIARGRPPEPHETFADFGPTVFAAAVGMVKDPAKALGALLVPEAKLASLGVTLAGTGALALAGLEVGVAALPLFAERFLSSKATMWEMGYHYAAPLTVYAGWAAARGLPRTERPMIRLLESLSPGRGRHWQRMLAVYLLLAGLLVNAVGYRHPSNYLRWRESYFSTPEKRVANAAAVAFVETLPGRPPVAAQNRILPHLADRAGIWRLGDRDEADVVVVSVGESAWPYDDGLPGRLDRSLRASPDWVLGFESKGTSVFLRATAGLDSGSRSE